LSAQRYWERCSNQLVIRISAEVSAVHLQWTILRLATMQWSSGQSDMCQGHSAGPELQSYSNTLCGLATVKGAMSQTLTQVLLITYTVNFPNWMLKYTVLDLC
jgi:hypothetical protein